jgi:two-component system, NtrC family, sensor histidine kinase PilS
MLVRAAVGTVLLGTTTLLFLRSGAALNLPAFLFVGLLYLLTMLYSLLFERVRNLPLFAFIQILGDQLLISGVLVLSGGPSSPFSVLYAVSIVSGSVLLYKPGGYLAAAMSSVLLGMLVLLDQTGLLQRLAFAGVTRTPIELSVQLSQLFLDCFGFILIGHLSGHLAERLRKSTAMLDVQSRNLLQLRHFNHQVLQSIYSGLVTTETEGIITSANRAALALLRVDFQSLSGRSIFQVFRNLVPEEVERACREQTSFDLVLEEAKGTRRLFELSPSALDGIAGQRNGYIFVMRDITELRRLEALEKEAEKLSALGEMASTIAHEIRNPLASMRGSIELLSRELALTGTNRRLMDIVLRESDRLNRLVSDFLSYARQRPPQLEMHDLAALLQEITLLLSNDESCRAVRIALELHATHIPLELDSEQIRQVVWNLAQNGIRAMGRTGVLTIGTREVLLSESTGQDGLCLWVRDTGCGIDPHELGRLFQPFRRGRGGGAGLGLAIVRRIVTAHHGDIAVESRPGGGTTVHVYLPLPQGSTITTAAGALT